MSGLFDHLVGKREQRRRHVQAECLAVLRLITVRPTQLLQPYDKNRNVVLLIKVGPRVHKQANPPYAFGFLRAHR
jgi:hypothetical protein